MEDSTIFLSQVIGPLFLIVGIAFVLHKEYYIKISKEFEKNRALTFMVSFAEAVVGLMIVLSHNDWMNLPGFVIGVIGWAMLLESSLLLVGTKYYSRFTLKVLSPGLVMTGGALMIILGIYFSVFGFLVLVI